MSDSALCTRDSCPSVTGLSCPTHPFCVVLLRSIILRDNPVVVTPSRRRLSSAAKWLRSLVRVYDRLPRLRAHSGPSELGQIVRVGSLMIGGVILTQRKPRMCIPQRMIERESEGERHVPRLPTALRLRPSYVMTMHQRPFSLSSPSSVDGLEPLFSP